MNEKEEYKPIKDREPDNEAISASFDTDAELRSNCGICGIQIVGTIEKLSNHFRTCNGPG